MLIDKNEDLVNRLRQNIIDFENKKILISKLSGSKESEDSYTDLNCLGYGRIRNLTNFSIHLSNDILPRKKLKRNVNEDIVRTQVFQIGGCNWRCWYCFVDFKLLSGNRNTGKFLSASNILDMWELSENKTSVIDLSGGNPDIAPEWCYWILKEVEKRGYKGKIHIWLDDNLGSNALFKYMDSKDIEYMASFPNHSRACCFKGYDKVSFSYNTKADETGFLKQFELAKRIIEYKFDAYFYITLTGPKNNITKNKIYKFIKKLMSIDPLLPLRCIPIEIKPFTANKNRFSKDMKTEQEKGYFYWSSIMKEIYSKEELELPYEKIQLKGHNYYENI